jgi:hypothetical protein
MRAIIIHIKQLNLPMRANNSTNSTYKISESTNESNNYTHKTAASTNEGK